MVYSICQFLFQRTSQCHDSLFADHCYHDFRRSLLDILQLKSFLPRRRNVRQLY